MAGECKATNGFVIAVIIISALMIALFVTNVVFYNKTRTAGGGGGLSATEARNLMAINAVWVALAGVVFIWGIIFLAVGGKAYRAAKGKAENYLSSTEGPGLLGYGSVTNPNVSNLPAATQ